MQGLSEFCIAQRKLASIQEQYITDRQPLAKRIEEIRGQLKKYLDDNKLTCVQVKVKDVDVETNEVVLVDKYLRRKQSNTITDLNPDGIERAINSVTPTDLKEQYNALKEKQSKPKKKRKREDTTTTKGGTIGGTMGGEETKEEAINMMHVWNATLAVKIRQEHLKVSNTMDLDNSPGRGVICKDKAPEAVRILVQEWVDKKRALGSIVEHKEEASASHMQVIEQTEQGIMQQLAKVHPVEKAQDITLTSKTGPAVYTIKTKQSAATTKVRITAFKPYIETSLKSTLQKHAPLMQDFKTACDPRVKADLVTRLRQQFIKFQEDHKSAPYVALEKKKIEN